MVPLPGDLPVVGGPLSVDPDAAGRLRGVEAITFDFGNTLVPVDRAGLARVVRITAEELAARCGPFAVDDVLAVWAEERARQFREEVPSFREVDLAQRTMRVLARLRGMPAPPDDVRWDDAAAAARSEPHEIDATVERYSRAFVEAMPVPADVTALLARLARRHRLAILSNWPLAVTIDRYAEAAGWLPHLAAIVVSQRVGTIKPHPDIFAAARDALGGPAPGAILHVGDDWAADVVGAKEAGWRAAYLEHRPVDSPLPDSVRDDRATPDLELRHVTELEAHLAA